MGTDERDRAKRSEEPDVEAHKAKHANDEGLKSPEDKASDETPDVEAHVNKH
jgi:hypothetical protein